MSQPQPDTTTPTPFHTLIVDAWCETSDSAEETIWRFRVRDVRTGTQQTFASISALLDHLHQQFGNKPAFL